MDEKVHQDDRHEKEATKAQEMKRKRSMAAAGLFTSFLPSIVATFYDWPLCIARLEVRGKGEIGIVMEAQ